MYEEIYLEDITVTGLMFGAKGTIPHFMGDSRGELSEELVTQEKRKKGWRMNCDVGEATDGLENEL